ncbi:MAG: phosphatidylserine decarboxylase [Candidatus Aminicenantes bacterium]|nr:phosphatidylserine decarboxylase [Candidatus Aminicenantes bacterium]
MIAKKSLQFIISPILLAVFFWGVKLIPLSILFFSLSLFCLFFFRDPTRKIGSEIVAPADGRIMDISESEGETRIAIFMNMFNVHVNRMPIDGEILGIERIRGKHAMAFLTKASENSRLKIHLDTVIGEITIVQIAGVFAWRIVPYITKGQMLKKGERIGIIRFGSRVDIFLPTQKTEVSVRLHQRVKAGFSTLAHIKK